MQKRELNRESNNTYLILGQSGRMLAQSAFEAGISTVVIDQFADQDTQRYAEDVKIVQAFSDDIILQTVAECWQEHACTGLVLASGFEARTGLIKQLEKRWPLLGNSHETVSAVKNPVYLSDTLKQLEIPHPPIRLEPPEKGEWLVKQQGACGGDHVHWFDKHKTYSSTHYYQAFQQGKSCSVVFLANGKEARIVGYNQIWTENDSSFRFGGAVTFNNFPAKKEIGVIISKLSRALKLTGLCGLDFILNERDQIFVLEINPRPVSTFDLHEMKSENLFLAHLNACHGQLDQSQNIKNNSSAKLIVYAKSDLEILNADWPNWVADTPEKGEFIKRDEPLCTVYGDATDADKAVKLVHNRQHKIEIKFPEVIVK